ncbi:MAG: DapH/DapD/GlmU-related protein [Solirubrobacteraceae bacterium]
MGWRTHGDGSFESSELGALGPDCVFEAGVMVFNPAHLFIGRDVYIGHRVALRADTRGRFTIGSGTWIGQDSYFQSAGGIDIGEKVGIGPRVSIITSVHEETAPPQPIINAPLEFDAVTIGDGCDIGLGAIILPGSRIGEGAQVGAGAVVSGDIPPGAVAAGVPARVLRARGDR